LLFKELYVSFLQYSIIFFTLITKEEWLMIRMQIARILLFFSISSLYHNVIFASLLEGTLVATIHGLVPIQALKVGDKVLGYDLEEPNHEKATREVAVTKIEKHLTDSLFTLCTETGWVEASPHQLIFTLLPKKPENKDLEMDFVPAQYITEECQLIDTKMKCLPIFETNRMSLICTGTEQYVEKKKHGKHKRVEEVNRCKIVVNMYALEVETPHVFLIGENTYVNDITKTRLLLAHNGIPALLSVTYQVASSSTLSFPSLLGGISVVGGPFAVALGITGLGYFGYQLFKGHSNGKRPTLYIERAGTSSPGGMDPKEPKDKEDAHKNVKTNLAGLNENKIHHILEGSKGCNHKWEKLVPDKSWNNISKIIENVMETGSEKPYGSAKLRFKIIKGEIVEVTYVVIDGVMKISDAWVK
jgi:hypothetical protein